MEKGIDNGCHVFSLSLGGGILDYYRDSITIKAFNVMEKGVLVSCFADNTRPSISSLSNNTS